MFLLFAFAFTACNDNQENALAKPAPRVPAKPTRDQLRANALSATADTAIKSADPKLVDLRVLAKREKNNGKIVRRNVSDFYAQHLGLPDVKNGVPLPDSLMVSFDANMAAFWDRKVLKEDVTSSTLSMTPAILARYMNTKRGLTTLPLFIKHTDEVVEKAKKSLDWTKLCSRYKFDQKKCQLLRDILSKLRGKDFIAYGMTELLPDDARFNILYMDMLLKNAGSSYLFHIPAMHDNWLSIGFYQFTSFSVRKDGEVVEGASVVNGFVKDGGYKIPDSVSRLVGDDHHVAAVYFAVHNLAKMIHLLDGGDVKTLASKHKDFQDQMVMFIASAHHLPGTAWKRTAAWVHGGMKGDLERSYAGTGIHTYALKTHANLIALYKG